MPSSILHIRDATLKGKTRTTGILSSVGRQNRSPNAASSSRRLEPMRLRLETGLGTIRGRPDKRTTPPTETRTCPFWQAPSLIKVFRLAVDGRYTWGRASYCGGAVQESAFAQIPESPMFGEAFRDLRLQPDGGLKSDGEHTIAVSPQTCTTTYSLTLRQAQN